MSEVQDILNLFEQEEARRANWNSLWQEVRDLNLPGAADFTTQRAEGQQQTLYDTTGVQAVQKSAAVLESLLHPRTQWFHRLVASNTDLMREREVALFFEELNRRLFYLRARPDAQFYDQANESDQSLVAYGNQCLMLRPTKDRRGIAYRHIHVGAVWVSRDDMGRVDTVFYKFKLSAKQAIQRWGDQAPRCAREAMDANKGWTEEEYLHVARPRRIVRADLLGAQSMPFESYEISLRDKECIPYKDPMSGKVMESGGRRTLGYLYSRMTSNPSENYGRGPAMLVLGDNRVLQRMERSSLLGGEMSVTPPLLAMSNDLMTDGPDGSFDLRPAAINPGWLDSMGNQRVKPLVSNFNLQESEVMKESKRRAINDMHFLTIFQILVNTPDMTATEALIRAQEKGALIAPMVGRQQSEWLGPQVEEELSLMSELDIMPPVPQALIEAQGEYKIEYLSSATRMQREEAVQAIRSTFVDVSGIAQVDPTAVEVLDAVESIRFIAESRGVPQHLIRSKKEFAKVIQAQAQAQARQATLAAVPPLAKAAKDLRGAKVAA